MGGKKRKCNSTNVETSNKKKKIDNQSMCLTGLNDDCIIAILKHLEMDDLVSVAQSCKKLHANAAIVFDITHNATIGFEYDPNNFAKQQKILRHFGPLAKKVVVKMPQPNAEINDSDDDQFSDSDDLDGDIFHADGDKVLCSIGRFCKPKLEELALNGFQIRLSSRIYSNDELNDVKVLLGNLKKLKLINVCTSNDDEFFKWLQSLNELTVHSCCDLRELCKHTLPQLKKLTIGSCLSVQIRLDRAFNDFLNKNPSIEELDYGLFELGECHWEGICLLPLLTHLEVTVFDDTDLSPITNAGLTKLIVRVMPDNNRQFSKLRRSLPIGCQFSIEKLQMHNH